MTCQPTLPKTYSGEGTSKHPGSAGSDSYSQQPLLPRAPCQLALLLQAEVTQTPLLAPREGKSSQETPTCRAVGAHAADGKQDVRITVKHLQRGPAVPLGEAGVPVQ